MTALPISAAVTSPGDKAMYGLISKITAQSGRRDELVRILVAGVAEPPPGCLSYIVAADVSDPSCIWVTEVWQSREAHAASLTLSAVKTAMDEGRALIAGFSRIAETIPVGGKDFRPEARDKFLP